MYIELIKKSFLQQFTYRANALLTLFHSCVSLFISANVWKALYSYQYEVSGIYMYEMLTYILIGQLLKIIVRLPISTYIGNRITLGNISIDLIRPINLKWAAMSTCVGKMLFSLSTTGLPMIIIATARWEIATPTTLFQWLAFFSSVILSILLYTTLEYIMGLTTFWTKTTFHLQWIINSFFTLFSGSIIPLWFYPNSIQKIASYLPFRFFIFEPINIFLGKASHQEALFINLGQITWLMILLIIEQLVWNSVQKSITIQGG